MSYARSWRSCTPDWPSMMSYAVRTALDDADTQMREADKRAAKPSNVRKRYVNN